MRPTKKLIEVALPLDAINQASVREKSIRHGHPSTLHLWWARRPLAAARAVIFAQMVDDPSEYVDVLLSDTKKKRAAERDLKARLANRECQNLEAQGDAAKSPELTLKDVIADHERERLFDIIKALVKWENTTNETVLQQARDEIWQSWRRTSAQNADHPRASELFDRHKLPSFHDPFAGGGALPLEAQRLGLEAFATDINPLAVLINKAMIEIPPRFARTAPVNPDSESENNGIKVEWNGAQGLAADVEYYGNWMRNEAKKRIGHLYPSVEITAQMIDSRKDLKPYLGRSLTVIAWIYARTVRSPDPAFSTVHVPLVSTFVLSKKIGNEAYIEPLIERYGYRFTVRSGKPTDPAQVNKGTKLSGGYFRCLLSGTPISYRYINDEANAGKTSKVLMAIIAEGNHKRLYLEPTSQVGHNPDATAPSWFPDTPCRGTWASTGQRRRYGFRTFGDYFTRSQLVALTTFSELVAEAREKIRRDSSKLIIANHDVNLRGENSSILAYSDAITLLLALVVSKCSDYWSSLCSWHNSRELIRNTFVRPGIAMAWDYAEANPFCHSSGNFIAMLNWLLKAVRSLPTRLEGCAYQADAASQAVRNNGIVSTDPPYYDNIEYADLSDFFYIWLRPMLRQLFPDLFSTYTVPKFEELVASAYRHGSREAAREFFLNGMTQTLGLLVQHSHPAFPVTIYYAFRQSETTDAGTVSTGWEIFLDAIIRAGFTITGTWPMRTELGNRAVSLGANALASSIALVCRPRPADAPVMTLREFITTLRSEVARALVHLRDGGIAPVDLAQAAVGPGMAVYSGCSYILDAGGRHVSVREALRLINQTLDEVLAEQDGECDSDSRWAVSWFEQYGFGEGGYGDAETLSKAKNTSVSALANAKILVSGAGKVRLLKPEELPSDWNPEMRSRLTDWEIVHHLIRVLETGGEEAASDVMRQLGDKVGTAYEFCYRLYTLCDRKRRFAEAMVYNTLVKSWPEILRGARKQSFQQSEIIL